jgi:hypothetical protein
MTDVVSLGLAASADRSGEESMGELHKAALVGGVAAMLALLGMASALEMRPILTLDVARKIVDACLA